MKRTLLAVIAVAALLFGSPISAQAEEPDRHPDVEYALKAVPGGVVVDPYTVVWPNLGMELSVPERSRLGVGNCPTGLYCAFADTGGSGTRLTFAVCATVSTAALTSVASIANARSSGVVHARNSVGTVLASATAGTMTNAPGGVTSLRCTV